MARKVDDGGKGWCCGEFWGTDGVCSVSLNTIMMMMMMAQFQVEDIAAEREQWILVQ